MIATKILTESETMSAIDADADFEDSELLERLSAQASQKILDHTGYDFGKDAEIDPTAKLCAELIAYDVYNRSDDHERSINSLLCDLKDKAVLKDEA